MSGSEQQWLVEVHKSVDAVEQAWQSLVSSENATPFQTFALMKLFYRQLAANGLAEPVIVLVRHPDGRPAGLFPLIKSRKHGLNWVHSDARPIDYGAPILDPALGKSGARAVIKAMIAAVPGIDLVYFNKMPAEFNGTPNLLVDLPNAGRLRLSAWYLSLAGRSPDQIRAQQHKSFRNNLKRRRRNLANAHNAVFSFAVGEEITESDFAAFSDLRAQSFEEKDRHNILGEEAWAGFYTGLRAGEAAPCRPWLAKLEADGEIIASHFGFFDGKRILLILPASKLGEWKSLSPGLLLIDESILYFQALGARYFDMSIGDMAYKIRFGCTELGLYDAMFPKTFLGHIYYLVWRVKVLIRNRMKRISED